MGAVDATVNLTLQLLPTNFLLPGLFISACIVSLCMGTSVGTIVALMPIAASLADKTDMSLPLMSAAIVGGAFFGDNLSFISDTTIVATQSQGCKANDKFKYNFFLVLPAAIIVFIIYLIMGQASQEVVADTVLWWKIIPYATVLITAALGMNVMLVLLIGNILTGIVGIADGSYGFMEWTSSMTSGIMGMSELIIVTLLAGGMLALIRYNGGIDYLIRVLTLHIRGKRGAKLTIALLVILADLCTANNTIALVTVGPMAREIADKYGIDKRLSASLLDTFSCFAQGMIPYGAQLLMAAGLAAITPFEIMAYLYYPMALGAVALMGIFFNYPRKYS